MESTKVTKIKPVHEIELKNIEAPEQKKHDSTKGNVTSRTEGEDSKQEKSKKSNIGSESNRNIGIKVSCKKFWQKCWCPVALLVPICIYVIFSKYFSHSRPFIFRVKTDATEPFTGTALSNRGFNLEYKQIPCSLSALDSVSFA